MHLVNKVLEVVDDAKTLHEQGEHTPSLLVMASMVNSLSTKLGHQRLNLKTSIGLQLKEALKKLPRDRQVELLTEFGGDTDFSALGPDSIPHTTQTPYMPAIPYPGITTEDHPMMLQEIIEDRRLKRWVIRCAMYVCMSLFLVMMGAVVALAWRGGLADGAVISSLMTTASEVLKIIISL
jgi:hypothetical protein